MNIFVLSAYLIVLRVYSEPCTQRSLLVMLRVPYQGLNLGRLHERQVTYLYYVSIRNKSFALRFFLGGTVVEVRKVMKKRAMISKRESLL